MRKNKRIRGAKIARPWQTKNAQIETSVLRLLRKWRRRLGLSTWSIEVRFDERELLASCNASSAYETAVLTFNLNRIRKGQIDVEELVAHELVHCMVWKASERSVTQVARALLRAYGYAYD